MTTNQKIIEELDKVMNDVVGDFLGMGVVIDEQSFPKQYEKIKSLLLKALEDQKSQLIKEIESFAIMKGSVIDKLVEKDEHARITNLLNENLEIGYRQACRDLLTLLKT